MKRVTVIIFLLTAVSFFSFAQKTDIRYKDVKDKYNSQSYAFSDSDPYKSTLAGVASLFVPGLGQGLCDEWGRTLGIMATNLVFDAAIAGSVFVSVRGGDLTDSYDYDEAEKGERMYIGGLVSAIAFLVGQISFNLWNVYDAVKVANTKNLCWRDRNGGLASAQMSFAPSFGLVPEYNGVLNPSAGLSLRVSF